MKRQKCPNHHFDHSDQSDITLNEMSLEMSTFVFEMSLKILTFLFEISLKIRTFLFEMFLEILTLLFEILAVLIDSIPWPLTHSNCPIWNVEIEIVTTKMSFSSNDDVTFKPLMFVVTPLKLKYQIMLMTLFTFIFIVESKIIELISVSTTE